MSTGNVSLDILLDQISNDAIAKSMDALEAIKKRYPSLSEKEAVEIHKLVATAATPHKDIAVSYTHLTLPTNSRV